MKKSNLWSLIFGSVGMLVVILDSKTAVAGIRDGVQLCLNTLIPSLFPFFILSSLITASLVGHSIRPLRSICKLCRMSPGSESFLAVGILGGYPVGAANIAGAAAKGSLTQEEAERMTVFCNNAGPSFLFGILGPMFPDQTWVWVLWATQIGASILTGFLLSGSGSKPLDSGTPNQVTLSDCLSCGIKSMALVCGWVVLFRMILEFLRGWILWLFPVTLQVIITGLLELSNGCLSLSGIESNSVRFLVTGTMLSMGGFCVWMQTKAVFPRLNLYRYIMGRTIHCLICFLLSLLVLPMLSGIETESVLSVGIMAGFAGICLFLILRKQKKAVAFCNCMVYNSV